MVNGVLPIRTKGLHPHGGGRFSRQLVAGLSGLDIKYRSFIYWMKFSFYA
jgi:hypothetical protein